MQYRILQTGAVEEPTYAVIEGRPLLVLRVHGWALVADIAGHTSTVGLVSEGAGLEPLISTAPGSGVTYATAEQAIGILLKRIEALTN